MRVLLDIHGVRCRVEAAPGALARAVVRGVEHLALPELDALVPAHASLAFEVGTRPPAPDAPPTVVHEGGYLRVWRLGDRFVLRTPHLETVVWAEAGTAVCTAPLEGVDAPGLEQELVVEMISALFLLLRPHGYVPLHAAALAHGGSGLLLVAASDAGKSTTAFNLVRHGWDFLSDDSVLLQANAEGVEALAFRRTFGLDAEADALFPVLAACEARQPSDPAKRAVPMTTLYPDQAALRCRPGLLLFPEITGEAGSELVPLAKTEALLGLAAQSALVTLRAEWTAPHLGLLGRLANQARAYRLRAGRDLLDDPGRILQVLAPAWPGPHAPARPVPVLYG